jgi:2-methylisocitrate lyase-like PEP mutase family enzyme
VGREFLKLHQPGAPVVVANVWDVATARWAREAGFAAVGTTSWAVAESAGYGDHEKAPGELMLTAAARIVRAVDAPVTVDAEAGYGLTAEELAQRIVDMGAAGLNIEETDHHTGELIPAERFERYVATLRAELDRHEDPPVLNARVDGFLQAFLAGRTGIDDELLPDVVARANRYLAAGADCTYPILASNPGTIGKLVERINGPINVSALPQSPTVRELGGLGVARISFGPRHWWSFQAWFKQELIADRDR